VKENVGSEILGVTLTDCVKTFGRRKIAELDVTDKTSGQTAEEILAVVERKSKREIGSVDWLALVSARGDISKFFDHEITIPRD
jgi:broad-specificity NMP kinase